MQHAMRSIEQRDDGASLELLVLQSDLAAAIARAEAAEAALDHIARVAMSSRVQTKRTQWIVARAVSALNGNDEWTATEKPKGYHDALERAAIAAQQAEGGGRGG